MNIKFNANLHDIKIVDKFIVIAGGDEKDLDNEYNGIIVINNVPKPKESGNSIMYSGNPFGKGGDGHTKIFTTGEPMLAVEAYDCSNEPETDPLFPGEKLAALCSGSERSILLAGISRTKLYVLKIDYLENEDDFAITEVKRIAKPFKKVHLTRHILCLDMDGRFYGYYDILSNKECEEEPISEISGGEDKREEPAEKEENCIRSRCITPDTILSKYKKDNSACLNYLLKRAGRYIITLNEMGESVIPKDVNNFFIEENMIYKVHYDSESKMARFRYDDEDCAVEGEIDQIHSLFENLIYYTKGRSAEGSGSSQGCVEDGAGPKTPGKGSVLSINFEDEALDPITDIALRGNYLAISTQSGKVRLYDKGVVKYDHQALKDGSGISGIAIRDKKIFYVSLNGNLDYLGVTVPIDRSIPMKYYYYLIIIFIASCVLAHRK